MSTLVIPPEPLVGSVVIDRNGEAHRRTRGGGWARGRSRYGTGRWEEMCEARGPLAVIAEGGLADLEPPVAGVAPLDLSADRPLHFRFIFKLVQVARLAGVEDVPMYEAGPFDVLDQWDGDSGRACRDLEDTLQRIVLRPQRRVVVSGGYV